jgi:clan AA aspartic protease
MGLIYAEIDLINGRDLILARENKIGEEEIRRIPVTMLVDAGSYMLMINENIQEVLQLPVVERRRGVLANGQVVECDVVSPVELRFKNRQTTCRAMVMPGDAEPLLGAIPLEDLDVVIHAQRQELIVNPDYPDMASTYLKAKKKVKIAS